MGNVERSRAISKKEEFVQHDAIKTTATVCDHGKIGVTEEAKEYTTTTNAIPSTTAAPTKPAQKLCPRYDQFGFALGLSYQLFTIINQ